MKYLKYSQRQYEALIRISKSNEHPCMIGDPDRAGTCTLCPFLEDRYIDGCIIRNGRQEFFEFGTPGSIVAKKLLNKMMDET